MQVFTHPACLAHDTGTGHPESAARLAAAPSVGVGTPVNWPSMEPMAVRLAPTITMETDKMASAWFETGNYALDAAVRQYAKPHVAPLV